VKKSRIPLLLSFISIPFPSMDIDEDQSAWAEEDDFPSSSSAGPSRSTADREWQRIASRFSDVRSTIRSPLFYYDLNWEKLLGRLPGRNHPRKSDDAPIRIRRRLQHCRRTHRQTTRLTPRRRSRTLILPHPPRQSQGKRPFIRWWCSPDRGGRRSGCRACEGTRQGSGQDQV
jgi:hypothetical protein